MSKSKKDPEDDADLECAICGGEFEEGDEKDECKNCGEWCHDDCMDMHGYCYKCNTPQKGRKK